MALTKNDEDPTASTPVGNEADRMQRREHLAAHTLSCALVMHR